MEMKDYEFYIKYKTNDRPLVNSVFYKRNWWQIILPAIIAMVIEPLIMYKRQRSVAFTLGYYLHLLEYCFFIAVPFLSFLLWLNWREWIKRNRGYGWVGRFEVIRKQSSFLSCYLLLAPGNTKLKVERRIFEKLQAGNFILIRRNALGNVEEVRKLNYLSSRLARSRTKSKSRNQSTSPPFQNTNEIKGSK